jgi:tetratricopeptide (TPR) repeat protein
MKSLRLLLRMMGIAVAAWFLIYLVILSPLHLFASSPLRLFVFPLTQDPVTPTEAMRVANQNYEAGQYAEASAIYEVIIESGLHHSSVYYNLGNAYFKQGDLGRAILNYRRAQRLDPRDADIAANLSIARAQTVDQLEAPAEGGLADLVKITEEWLTLREAILLALTLWLLIGFLAVLALLKPVWRRWSGIGLGMLALFLVIGLISIANRSYTEQNYPAAVVVAQEVDVTSGPGTSEQYLVEFTLHAGAEVSLIESRSNWGRISLPGDLQGWIPAEAVERVSE